MAAIAAPRHLLFKKACRKSVKPGSGRQISVFTPHFRKRPPEVCGKFRNPQAHRSYRIKKPQVKALSLSGVVDPIGFCRILPDLTVRAIVRDTIRSVGLLFEPPFQQLQRVGIALGFVLFRRVWLFRPQALGQNFCDCIHCLWF